MKTLFSILIFFLFFSFFANSQDLDKSYFLFSNNGSYKYFVGNNEPDALWNTSGYDDAAWPDGRYSIGYGDGDDSTLIDTKSSVYLRIKFNVAAKALIGALNLMADFDDGFVAYLNGKEIVRVNLGDSGAFVAHDQTTTRSHEAFFYRNYFRPVCGHFIDSVRVASLLKEGDNILAIQVHNDSAKGSDLSFNCNLINLKFREYNLYWDEYRCIKQVYFELSKLPILKINTDEYGISNRDSAYIAWMGIINNANGINKPTDTCTDYNGRISIKLRGKSSADFPKKSFKIETLDSLGENLNVKLIGMPKDNDWTLYGPFTDKSLLRTEIAFLLGRKQGHYEPRTRFCELIFNDEYMGLYILTEKIKQDKKRVDIAVLTTASNSGTALSGGYIISNEEGRVTIEYPKYFTEEQNNYVQVYYTEFYKDTAKYDRESLFDYIIINEVTKNCDAYYLSTYTYKNRDDMDGRIKFGPLWDYDLAFGNSVFQEGGSTQGWQFEVISKMLNTQVLGIIPILKDTQNARLFINKYNMLRKTGYLHSDSLTRLIDSIANYIKDSRIRNFEVWPIIDKELFFQSFDRISFSYDQEMVLLKTFLSDRLAWIDSNISSLKKAPTFVNSGLYLSNNELTIYPNPFSDKLTFQFTKPKNSNIKIELTDIYGRISFLIDNFNDPYTEGQIILSGGQLSALPQGVYIVTVYSKGKVILKNKVIKH